MAFRDAGGLIPTYISAIFPLPHTLPLLQSAGLLRAPDELSASGHADPCVQSSSLGPRVYHELVSILAEMTIPSVAIMALTQ